MYFIFIILVSVLFILGVLGPWEFLWRAGSYFLSVRGSAVWSVGPVQFIWALAWGGWRGCTGFSSFGLCCGEYGTIYLSAGRGWVAGLYRFFFWYYLTVLCSISC